MAITATDITQPPYSADKTGETDGGGALRQWWIDNPGGSVFFPEGTYKFTTAVEFFSTATIDRFGPMPKIYGDGIGKTFIDNRIANGPMWDFDAKVHCPFNAAVGGVVTGLTFMHGTTVVC